MERRHLVFLIVIFLDAAINFLNMLPNFSIVYIS
nr:MAG TPA: hypothetical protein [Caudoviricetes sp.]